VQKSTSLAIISMALCPWMSVQAQAPADPQKAAISGHVTSATGEALKKVTIRLQSLATQPGVGGGVAAGAVVPNQPSAMSASTDAQGDFIFDNLDPGRYTLSAERAGYIRENYTPPGGSALLTLTAGQKLTGVAFKMTPESSISGRVFDSDGDPLPKARVQVSRVQYSTRGKQLLPAGNATTSLDGTYRVEGLSAGRYYLTAQDSPNIISMAANTINANKAPEEAHVTTYYPSALDMSTATPIAVTAGGEMRAIDVRMVKARVFHIRGKVLDTATGSAPSNAMVRATPKDSVNLINLTSNFNGMTRNGVFDIGPLPPGEYVLMSTPFSTSGPDGKMTVVNSVGREVVRVGSSDVNDLVFRIGPGAEVTGKITTEPGSAQPQSQPNGQTPAPGANLRPRVQLIVIDGANQGSTTGEAKEDGTFAIHNVAPATYQVQVLPMPPGMYLKSVRYGSQDISKGTLDLTNGGGATLDVLLSPNSADVSGTLHGSDGAPLSGVTLTLWTPGPLPAGVMDQPRNARTDASGNFKFAGIAPGQYRIAAWEQVPDMNLMLVPEFRAKFETQAAKVSLVENAHETVDAPLMKRDVIDAAANEVR
jgi:protocatechuate 3,4-dioxygenase beta subunit